MTRSKLAPLAGLPRSGALATLLSLVAVGLLAAADPPLQPEPAVPADPARSTAPRHEAEPLDVSAFDDDESWPLYAPGDVAIPLDALGTQRTVFRFQSPDGSTSRMTADVYPATLAGEPAWWIQHLSQGERGDPEGSSVLDALLVDAGTFRIGFRIEGAPGPRAWAGPYLLTQHHPDRVAYVSVSDTGEAESTVHELATDAFDFATMAYMLPHLGLEQGNHYRLANIGGPADPTPRVVSLRVGERTRVRGASGRSHAAHEVHLLTASRQMLITLLVSDEAPYFFGWEFRLVRDGSTLAKMEYLEHHLFDG